MIWPPKRSRYSRDSRRGDTSTKKVLKIWCSFVQGELPGNYLAVVGVPRIARARPPVIA
jgi:hypothetical protein